MEKNRRLKSEDIDKYVKQLLILKEKEDIESITGPLEWKRLDESRSSSIALNFDGSGLKTPEKWEVLQDKMIDAMIAFDNAFGKRIKNIKI